MGELEKKCKKCGKLYPATKEYFHVHTVIHPIYGSTWRGLRPKCKNCRNEERREYWRKKNEKKREI